jgi:hypothetical protein
MSCAKIFLTVTILSSVVSVLDFKSLHSVMAVLGRLLRGKSLMSLLLSLKYFFQSRTLLAPLQESP